VLLLLELSKAVHWPEPRILLLRIVDLEIQGQDFGRWSPQATLGHITSICKLFSYLRPMLTKAKPC